MAVATALREYVASHPHAADSIDGVARWWLPPPHSEAPRDVIDAALEELAGDGVLTKSALPGGIVIYAATTR